MFKFATAVILLVVAAVLYLTFTSPRVSGPQGGENIRFGFIKGVSTNGNYGIAFDEAEWLTGEEGENAAIAAGLCTEATRAECLPDGFIIKNDTTTTQNLEFDTGVTIAMFTLNMEEDGVRETHISKEDFEKLINNPRAHWKGLPYQVLLRNGLVTIIEEVYVP